MLTARNLSRMLAAFAVVAGFVALLILGGALGPARAEPGLRTLPLAELAAQPAAILRKFPTAAKSATLAAPDHFPGGGNMVAEARRWLGSRNMTGTRGPWCRDFVNMVIVRSGLELADTSRRAIDALRLGPRLPGPRIGAVVVMRHHTGFVTGVEAGRIIVVSGNSRGGRVSTGSYPIGRALAFIAVN